MELLNPVRVTMNKSCVLTIWDDEINKPIAGETFLAVPCYNNSQYYIMFRGKTADAVYGIFVNDFDVESVEDYAVTIEKIVEIEKEVIRTINLRDVLGQDIKEIKL